jgi:hypothetical protein
LPLIQAKDISAEVNERKERDEQSHSGPPHGQLSVLLQLRSNTEIQKDKNAKQGDPLKGIDPQNQAW